jgi:carbonic anhydrase
MKLRFLANLPLSVAAILIAACSHPSDAAAGASHAGGAEAHWSYAGATGPEHWGALSPEYALCATGTHQSPIDIRNAENLDLQNLVLHYSPTPVTIVDNGHTVQVDYAPGSSLEVDGVRYELAQFHFHAPSEHTIAGKHAPAEMHLVHKSATGALAVVGVLLEEGDQNSHFDPVLNNLPEQPGAPRRLDVQVNANDLLPADQRTWRYEGSLTTPPGTEGVRWFLMVEPVKLSAAQITALTRVCHGNSRPTQALNGRKVLQDSTR